jgi:uncharacterized repeat protein (TIGR01451 family)
MKISTFGITCIVISTLFLSITGQSIFAEDVIRGQLPPNKLVRQETNRSNPLRINSAAANAAAKPLPAGRLAAAPSQTQITQASLQAETEPSSFADPFAPLGQPTAAQTVPAMPSFEVPASPASLSSADPFGAEQPSASVPPAAVAPKVQAQRRQTPLGKPQPITEQHDGIASDSLNNALGMPVSSPIAQEGTGTPGPAALEGQQTPHLTIHKILPAEVIVDQQTVIKTVIQNVGKSAAKNVVVLDRVPQGSRLISTTPEANLTENDELHWSLGNLNANEQVILETRILPFREGEIGSIASINYSGEASARIAVTRPMLKVDVKAPAEIQLGQVADIEIVVSNPGTATASGIVLEEYIPDGLYHKDGKTLTNDKVGALKPGETKTLILPLTCTGAGNLVNYVVVKANGNLLVEDKTTIRALAPALNLEITGSRQRFLERKSDYRLVVGNNGTASAKNVDLILTLPSAVKFVSTNQSGVYEPQTHTVHWALEELPAQESGEIELSVMPTMIGEHSLRFTGNGQGNLKAETVFPMIIDGLPAISFEVVGDFNLVEAGKDATYEIRVVNKGTKAAGNVKVRTNLADGMTFVKAEGGRYQANGGVVQYETIPQLEAKGEKIFKVAARCPNDGDYRVSVQVISDDLSIPITKEESTKVFK